MIKHALFHPKIGTLLTVFNTELDAMRHLACAKNKSATNEEVKEKFEVFKKLGWKVEKYYLTKID